MRLTPQLIQAMDILQLPLTALEAQINAELEKNPVLERVSDEATREPSSDGEQTKAADEDAVSFERLERMAREYDFDAGDTPYAAARGPVGDRDAKLDAMANTASPPQSLPETLLEQWQFLDLPEHIRRAGESIINHIDEDGYLRTELAQVAESVYPPLPVEEMESALAEVQSLLEPPGIGARDLVECLELQLDRLPGDVTLERAIVRHHLEDIEKNRLPAIAKATGRDIDDVKEAIEVIRHLRPHPGADLIVRDAPRIIPDVMVEYDENGKLVARLTRGNSPRLRISGMYAKMLQERVGDKDTREFIRRNLEAAKALLDAIQFRRDRLLEVAEIVLERQREFFDIGPAGLKVLRMAELAERFGCDASTISRTVAEKYMQTPRGIYPLRYFFTGGTETDTGESTSWDSVRERVKEIILAEDKSNPLSDDKVADMLKSEGIEVSRRTIAKYRQQLDIPSARQRKEY